MGEEGGERKRGRQRRDEAGERQGAGGGRWRSPGKARDGQGKRARLRLLLLSDSGPKESLSQKHKETPALARPNPEPAPGAERAIGRALFPALGEFYITKTQLVQSESSGPRPLVHTFLLPTQLSWFQK